MTLISKVKWVLGILMVFFLIVATNLLDRDNFRRINDSVTAIYEDRLLVKNLIFELSLLIQEKEIAHTIVDTNFLNTRNESVNKEIDDLVLRYLDTKFTDKEARIFNDLKTNLDKLKNYENASLAGQTNDAGVMGKQIVKVKENLYSLSKIQLDEGRRQVALSQEAMDTIDLFTRLEIYFLIALALLVQIIVIYKPKDD